METNLLKDIRAVVFDFDGTLAELNIDFADLYVRLFGLMDRYGVERSKLSERYLIELIDEAAAHLSDGKGDPFRAEALAMVEAEETACASRASLFPGTLRLLGDLRGRGTKVGLVTRNAQAAVKTVFPDVDRHVDCFLPRERTQKLKPHPAHLLAALSCLAVPPHQAAMVGDHPIDIESALAAGMIPVGVTTGKIDREGLLAAGAVLVLDRAEELMEYI